ncbi:heparinase II/III family protein [Halobacteria archaeon HArc-gm2]|nr:heparinase II/III family protein [Halobacteria archaeon HArc-gm2]
MTSDQQSRIGFFLDPGNWPLFYHTGTNMRRQQLAGVLERKLRHALIPRLPIDFDARYEQQIPGDVTLNRTPVARNLAKLHRSIPPTARERLQSDSERAMDGTLEYMNRPLDIADGSRLQWNDSRLTEIPLFWRLKLHGFAFLELAYLGYESPADCPSLLVDCMNSWILDWGERTEIGSEGYLRKNWIPHSVSLRLVNLSRYLAWWDGNLDPDVHSKLAKILYKNALFMSNHVEHDVGGNHLIENAAGLVLAGSLLESDREGWLKQGLFILTACADQFFDDGGHFERSPMYHVQCLTRYLTAYDLTTLSNTTRPLAIEDVARNATGYLESIRPPDGKIPLLNDSVLREALPLEACLDYAEAVGITDAQSRTLDASGYYWLGSGDDTMLVDGGAVGPPHLPAHSHNDLLSFLLWVDGEQVLADTGVFEYAASERRFYSRSVSAHNTIQVGGSEPIDIAGQYLMGRRTQPTVNHRREDSLELLAGDYHVRKLFGERYRHGRRIHTDGDWWLVLDRIEGANELPKTSRLHFSPEVSVRRSDENEFQVHGQSGSELCNIHLIGCESASMTTSRYFPEFGHEISRAALEATYKATPSGMLISVANIQHATYDRGQDTLEINGSTYDLIGRSDEL